MADWIQQMAEVEDHVAGEQQVQQDEVATEPANSPRSTELVVPPEQPVQQRPVFGRQPAPPPRAERPRRTTQQWLRQPPEDEALQQQMEQEHLAHLEAAAQWEEQMRQQTQLTQHEAPAKPSSRDNSDWEDWVSSTSSCST